MVFLACFLAQFAPGETLLYEVRYGPMRLGSLELVTLARDTAQAELCHRFRAVMETNPAFALVFEARYVTETWCRVEDMVTLRSYKQTREKRYEAEWVADYDYGRGVVWYSTAGARFPDDREHPLRAPARDLLTTWYYFRTLALRPPDSVSLYVHTDRREYDAKVRATRRMKMKTPAGEFRCVELVPRAAGPLAAVYLSEDRGRVPVVIRTQVGGAVVSAYLRELRSPK